MSTILAEPTVSPRRCQRAESADDAGQLSPSDFEIFIGEYSHRLLAVARRILRSEEDAADALQDALLAAYVARSSYRGNSTVYTWLHRIITNTCLMKLRTQRRVGAISQPFPPATRDGAEDLEQLASLSTSVATRLEVQETLEAVRACLDQLPEASRQVILLRDFQQLDIEEAAAMLNLSYVAFKTRLHRARQALRRLLDPII